MAGQELNILGYLEAGIKAEGARQSAIASNIANMNTPGYRRIDVRFEEILGRAIEANEKIDPSQMGMEFYQPKTTAVKGNGNDVTMDTEVGELVKNTLRHKTYMLLLKKKYQQMQTAIRTQ
ncbi:MAG: flagellar basal body rod protein FlgB [Planctomycetota bacterium]|jgi:flagellar basal-body rod protein FlgB